MSEFDWSTSQECLCGKYINDDNFEFGTVFWSSNEFIVEKEFARHIKIMLKAVRDGDMSAGCNSGSIFDRRRFPVTGLTQLEDVIGDIVADTGAKCGQSVMRCTKCGRIYLEKKQDTHKFTLLNPISEDT